MEYIALGCMSGTSLDGIDLSLIRSDGETYSDEILNYFQPYSKELRRNLHSIIQKGYLSDPNICIKLTEEYAQTMNQFLNSNKHQLVIFLHYFSIRVHLFKPYLNIRKSF